MKEISLNLIKELREKSGVGIMEVKKALKEAGGDIEKALVILRERGQIMAASKQSRQAKEGWIGHYVHTNGQVASLVEVFCETDFVSRNKEFQKLAHELAMQVVALNPKYLSSKDVPVEVIEKEKEIYRQIALKENKPKKAIDKIIKGKLEKFYGEVCLLKQPFFKDEKRKVEDIVAEKVTQLGEKIEIGLFVRLDLKN